jgi:hypothetical protein
LSTSVIEGWVSQLSHIICTHRIFCFLGKA